MKSRTYRQGARAEGAERTRLAILAAAKQLAGEKLLATITLADVAERAGITVQTVLRRFGTRDNLLSEAMTHFLGEVATQRRGGDRDANTAVAVVVDQYERSGAEMLMLLGQETLDAQAARVTALGRELHDTWVRETFSPIDDRQHRLLVVATDLYTWKLLRRDRQLSQRETERHMLALCRAIIGENDG